MIQTISGWIARENGCLYLVDQEPIRKGPKNGMVSEYIDFNGNACIYDLPKDLFPQITFENSPQPCTITIEVQDE
jgi:hypothetical protein